jgi:glucosylceramidase
MLVRGVHPLYRIKNMLNGGRLLPEFYQAWANYYVKFIDSYQKGFLFRLTVQNEPMAKQTWESCIGRGRA